MGRRWGKGYLHAARSSTYLGSPGVKNKGPIVLGYGGGKVGITTYADGTLDAKALLGGGLETIAKVKQFTTKCWKRRQNTR